MKDVLFIIHDNMQEDNTFPLGIGYLSAILEKNGYSVEIYCMDIYHNSRIYMKEGIIISEEHVIILERKDESPQKSFDMYYIKKQS